MPSPAVNVPSSQPSRNPKRRQRNTSEDSQALRHNPKRLRRSGLTSETFEPPDSAKTNGHIKQENSLSLLNGHATNQRDAASDTASLAIRNRASDKVEKRRGGLREEGTVLTKNDFYVVSQLPSTPERFGQNQSPERWRGEIYPDLGFALVTTQEHAVVWRYTLEHHSSEPMKPQTIKYLHPATNSRNPLPLGKLVPTSTELALVIVMPVSGKVTYWENIHSATTADPNRLKQHCTQGVVSGMMSGEVINSIIEGEPHGFVLTLSSGRVAHMTVSDLQGKSSINVRYLRSDGAQSVGLFEGLKNVFGNASVKRDIAAVRAGFSAHRGHRQLVVATSKGEFQIWGLNWSGSQSLLCEVDGKADLLKSLVEGGDVFRDRQDHHFEVLDFVFSPLDLETKQRVTDTGKADCQLWVLTALHGADSSRYNLLGLTIVGGSLNVKVVHPISCYRSPMSPDTQFKPQVLVPERGFAAFVVFEKSVVLVSLIEVEESPSSQLRAEAHVVPDPFQDSIELNKAKAYRNIACAAESAGSTSTSSCLLMVHGFGVVRFLALPMQKDQSADERATVTATTKIEQAVFFGNMPQDLLDFSGRPEISFSQEQIEAAAEDISHSILKGESKYIPKEMPNMEAQLQRRAKALMDLIRHIRHRYGTPKRSTRWRLLWDAEKMAAALAMWRVGQVAANTSKKDTDKRNFLAEVIETCSERYKLENRYENHEYDGVRHWFMNDIWRIEELLPYTEVTVTSLLEDNVDDQGQVDLATHSKWISDAGDIQIAVLDTAYHFRELNMRLYELAGEGMIDGILVEGYEDLEEPWTAEGNVTRMVKELLQRAVKFAEDFEDAELEDVEIVAKLKKNLPGQIQIYNATQIEQFRWMKSRSDPHEVKIGKSLQDQYFRERKDFFLELAILGLGDDAIRLSEHYEDMGALVELMEIKRVAAEVTYPGEDVAAKALRLQGCDQAIIGYFGKYGNLWADAFFIKHIANGSAGMVLDKSHLYQKQLTNFLRRKPQYSKLRWINEVTAERNYKLAAEGLHQAQDRESRLWCKKIELSLGKLALMAATQQTQVKEDGAKEAIRKKDLKLAILAIQEELYDYIRPMLSSAIDVDAEADLVMERYKGVSEYQLCIRDSVKQNVSRLVAREVLHPEDLIDTLIFMDPEPYDEYDDYIDQRYFHALMVLRYLDYQRSDPARHRLIESAIWRRCYIQDDWAVINRTENRDEEEVIRNMEATALFNTVKELYAIDLDLPLPPPHTLLEIGTSLPSLRTSSRYTTHPDADLSRLAKDIQHETRILNEYIEKGRLEQRYPGVVEAAKESVKMDREEDLEEVRRQREREVSVLRVLREKSRVGWGDGEGEGSEGSE